MAILPAYNPDSVIQSALGNYTVSNVLAASTPEFITVPTDENGLKAKYAIFKRGYITTTDFFARCFSTAESTDRVVNGNFTTDTDWTKGAGWTIGAGVATATGAISTNLSQTATTAYPVVSGQAYWVTYTATRSAGTVTINVGGTAGTARSTSATFSEIIIAGATQVIEFTTAGFTGTVDALSVIACASVPIDSTTGLSAEQNPTGYLLNSNTASISIVSAGTPTITTNFYK